MKLTALYEQVVGHWQKIYSPYHVDPKMRKKKKKQDLSFRIKGKKKISKPGKKKKKKEPKGGADKTQALETGARPRGYGRYKEMGMKDGDTKGGSDRLHGKPGKVPGGELKACQDRTSKGIELRQPHTHI